MRSCQEILRDKEKDYDSTSRIVEYVKDDPWNDSESSNNCVDTENFEGGELCLVSRVTPIVIDDTLFLAIFLAFIIEFIKVKVEWSSSEDFVENEWNVGPPHDDSSSGKGHESWEQSLSVVHNNSPWLSVQISHVS